MMKLEEKLALKDLPKYYKEVKLRKFAENIVKYQNFRVGIAITKFEHDYTINTARSFFSWGVHYIKTGLKTNNAGSTLYKFIQEFVDKHVTPLTPGKGEARRLDKRYRDEEEKYAKPESILKTVEIKDDKSITKDIKSSIIAIQPSEIEPITEEEIEIYGLKNGQSIRIMEEEDIDNFIKTTILLDGKCEYKKIKLQFEEI